MGKSMKSQGGSREGNAYARHFSKPAVVRCAAALALKPMRPARVSGLTASTAPRRSSTCPWQQGGSREMACRRQGKKVHEGTAGSAC